MTGPCNNNKLFLSQVVYLDEAFLSGISDSAVLVLFYSFWEVGASSKIYNSERYSFERLGPREKYTVEQVRGGSGLFHITVQFCKKLFLRT